MSSPRDTGTSRPRARVLRTSRTAAALLFTTVAASAPVSRASHPSTWVSRSPRLPVARSISRFTAERAASAIASMATSGSSARPRLVCRTVPLKFRTGRSDGATAARARRSAASATRRSVSCAAAPGRAPESRPVPLSPRRAAARTSSTAPRTASTTSSRPCSRAHASTSGLLSIRSTPGRNARFPPSSAPGMVPPIRSRSSPVRAATCRCAPHRGGSVRPAAPRSVRLRQAARPAPSARSAPQARSTAAGNVTPVPPSPQYPDGTFARYCWWKSSAK